jgi:hypothetical protein
MGAEISPVNAPSSSKYIFCAPIFSGEPFAASMVTGRSMAAGKIAISTLAE